MSGAIALMGGVPRRVAALSLTVGTDPTGPKFGYNIHSFTVAFGALAPTNTYTDNAAIAQLIQGIAWLTAAGALAFYMPSISGQALNNDNTFRRIFVNGIAFSRASAVFTLNSPALGANQWHWLVANPFGGVGTVAPVFIEV